MKFTKKELGYYTDLYTLTNISSVKERYIAYGDILFENISVIAKKEKQIIIINEEKNGGVIFGSLEYADVAYKRLQELMNKNDKYIKKIKVIEKGLYKKISFSIEKKWSLS